MVMERDLLNLTDNNLQRKDDVHGTGFAPSAVVKTTT